MAERFLLADVGGTNTRLGLADASGLHPRTAQSLANADFAGVEQMIARYLADRPGGPSAICAGVAGPVRDGAAHLTNHPWRIDAAALRAATGAGAVHLINDLQAQGYALDDIGGDGVTTLKQGAEPGAGATRLVIGLGTGFNVAVVHRRPGGLFVPPAESGHASLPHGDAQANALVAHLAARHPHKPVEAALSGPGLLRIHRWLGGTAASSARVVAAHAAGTDPLATEALRLFARLLGQVAGDLALAHLPMGGIFLIGGTARAVAPHLMPLGVEETFTAKGPYRPILEDIPLFRIADDSAALLGCARYLRQSMEE